MIKILGFLMNTSDDSTLTFSVYHFQIDNHFPSSKLTDFASEHAILFPKSTKFQKIPSAMQSLVDATKDGWVAWFRERLH